MYDSYLNEFIVNQLLCTIVETKTKRSFIQVGKTRSNIYKITFNSSIVTLFKGA